MVAKEDDNINRNANNEKRDSDGQISVNRHSIISDSSKSRVKNHHKKVHFQLGFQRFYNLVGLLQVYIFFIEIQRVLNKILNLVCENLE